MLEAKKKPFRGAVMQLGRQDIVLTYEMLQAVAANLELPLRQPPYIGHRKFYAIPELNTIDDFTFFYCLGFDTVHSLDASNYEDATYVVDLNNALPLELYGKYDFVFNGGTLEHVFNVPNALSVVHNLLVNGGKVAHYVPTHNFVDHGFYCFSPVFFHDYYLANSYEIATSCIVGHRIPFSHEGSPQFFDYNPGDLDRLSHGGVTESTFNGAGMLGFYFAALKTMHSTCTVVPQQGYYRNARSKTT